MADRLKNKIAIITGAGTRGEITGIGQAAAVLMAKEGAKILINDIDVGRAKSTLEQVKSKGGEGVVFIADCTKENGCKAIVDKCKKHFGSIDILFNNVGGIGSGMVTEIDEKSWQNSIDYNLKSAVMMSKHVVPIMSESMGGSIINLSSIDAIRAGATRNVPYSVAKAGVSHLTRLMAVHHGRENIRVNCLAPGHVYGSFPNSKRKMTEELRELRRKTGPLGSEGTPWDVAWAVVFLASEESRWISGTVIPVDAGVLAASPLSVWDNLNE
jgi:NAD(P)-dependent dehydrogenase (short-subunit alcohol dehydrogenase family)|tara:strand:+ start:1405 stop:2214 length:810 start_codon:yes stop_codon:yes gene_type:complete